MATGRSPLEHGILDFVRVDVESGAREPITSDERRVPAIWNIASWAGREVAVLGLWATYPAEAVRGVVVSDRLFGFLFVEGEPPAGAAYPPHRDGWAREALRRAEAEVDLAALREYLPWLEAEADQRHRGSRDPYAHPVSALRRILVETRVHHALATDVLRRERPDLTLVYLQGTDTVGHVFAPFAPPRQRSVPEAEFARYRDVPRRYFAAVDRLLGEYRELARARGAVLLLVSDHGFRWHQGRPERLSSVAAATAAKWHRDAGIYLLWGDGVAAGAGEPAGVRRVCATLLALLGLPPGAGTAGPPLPGTPRARSASAEPVDYAAYYRPPARRPLAANDRARAHQELAKLQALGYLGGGGAKPAPGPVASSRTAASWNNQGLILQGEGRLAEAEAAFAQAIAADPGYGSALWNLSDLLDRAGRDVERSDRLLLRALAADLADGPQLAVARAIAYQRSGQLERAARLMDGAVAARPRDPELLLFRGRYRMERGDCAGARADFAASVAIEAGRAAAHASLGLANLCLGERAAARAALARSLALDPEQPQVRALLADGAADP
jgi:tetratricopeptide (TPR) repeat protein